MNQRLFPFQALLLHGELQFILVAYSIILIFFKCQNILHQRNVEWSKIQYEKSNSREMVSDVRIPGNNNPECNSHTTFGLLLHKTEASV